MLALFMILISLILHTYAESSEEKCARWSFSDCPSNDIKYSVNIYEVPSSEQEFDKYCRFLELYINCYEDYEKDCPFGGIFMMFKPFDFHMNARLVRELCNKDTKLHIEYVKHMRCIQSTIETEWNVCKNGSEEMLDNYYDHLTEKLKNKELDRKSLRDYIVHRLCLENTYKIICMLSQIEHVCSKDAAVVSREILERSSFPLMDCSVKDFLNLKTGFLKFLADSHQSVDYLKAIVSSPELVEYVSNPRHVHIK